MGTAVSESPKRSWSWRRTQTENVQQVFIVQREILAPWTMLRVQNNFHWESGCPSRGSCSSPHRGHWDQGMSPSQWMSGSRMSRDAVVVEMGSLGSPSPTSAPALGWALWSSLGRLSQCIPAPSSAPGVQEILPSHSLLSTGRVELSRVAGSRESSLISQGWELNHSCHELLLWRTENPTRR